VQGAQQVSASFANLQKLQEDATQAFLVETEDSISKRMRETRGYLEFTVDVAEKQILRRSEAHIPKAMVQLAGKALYVAKLWNKLQRKVKRWGGFLSFFCKPYQTLPPFEIVSGNHLLCLSVMFDSHTDYSFAAKSRADFISRVIATPDTLIHPYLIEFEVYLQDMWNHFLSLTHFWAHTDSDPTMFTSWLRCVLLSPFRPNIDTTAIVKLKVNKSSAVCVAGLRKISVVFPFYPISIPKHFALTAVRPTSWFFHRRMLNCLVFLA
jgi:hypothetical protein